MLNADRVINQYAQLVVMMQAADTRRDFKAADDVVNGGGKTHWQRIPDSAARDNTLYAKMQPIKDWQDAVTAHAITLLGDPTLDPDWARFEQGAAGDDGWKSSWTRTLGRFS